MDSTENKESQENTENKDMSDLSTMTTEELSRLVGASRALRLQHRLRAPQHTQVVEQPRSTRVKRMQRTTTSRAAQFSKLAVDGFTPLRQPAMLIRTEYDRIISVPLKRTWEFRDPFQPFDRAGRDITERWTIEYPCTKLEKVARDLTNAWHVYANGALSQEDSVLLANTPIHVTVDGTVAARYADIWSGMRDPGMCWRVARRAGVENITSRS